VAAGRGGKGEETARGGDDRPEPRQGRAHRQGLQTATWRELVVLSCGQIERLRRVSIQAPGRLCHCCRSTQRIRDHTNSSSTDSKNPLHRHTNATPRIAPPLTSVSSGGFISIGHIKPITSRALRTLISPRSTQGAIPHVAAYTDDRAIAATTGLGCLLEAG